MKLDDRRTKLVKLSGLENDEGIVQHRLLLRLHQLRLHLRNIVFRDLTHPGGRGVGSRWWGAVANTKNGLGEQNPFGKCCLPGCLGNVVTLL